MEWIPLKDLVAKVNLHRRTVTRRIQKMKKTDPDLYGQIVKETPTHRLYKDPQVTAYVLMRSTDVDTRDKKKKTVTHRHHKRKARPVKKNIQDMADDIWADPVGYTMDEETKLMHQELKTEAERIRFEAAVRIMYDYKFLNLTLDQACHRHGGDRHRFKRWCHSIAQINRLYQKAKVTRAREIEDERVELHEQTIDMTSQGYQVELPSVEYMVRRDLMGRVYKIPIMERVTTKHVSRNANSAIFYLTNKKKGEYARFHAPVPHDAGDASPMDPLLRELEGKSPEELMEIYQAAEQERKQLGG